MKCSNCGFENEQVNFCANCGADLRKPVSQQCYVAPQLAEAQAVINPVNSLLNFAFKDSLFLVIAILVSVSCVVSVFVSGVPPLLPVLYTVFLWITYAAAHKGDVGAKHIKNFSGVLTAEYVIGYVLAGLMAVLGILVAIIFVAFGRDPFMFEELIHELEKGFPQIAEFELTVDIMPIAAIVFLIVFVCIAVAVLLINILCIRRVRNFARDLHKSAERGQFFFEKSGSVATILIVLGVFTGVGVLSSLGSGEIIAAVSNGTSAAASIIGSIWLRRYIMAYNENSVEENETSQPQQEI